MWVTVSGTVTHTSNGILDETLLSYVTIGKVSASPPPANPNVLLSQTLMIPAVKNVSANATLGNTWTNQTPRRVSRTVIDGTNPGNIGHACGIGKTSSPDLIGIIGDTDRPCGLNVSQDNWDTRKYYSPDLRKSKKLDTSINQQFTNNLVAPPIFAEVLGEKLSNSSIRDIYTRCRKKLVVDPVNIPAPQFMDLGLLTINALDKGASLCTPTTRV